MFAATAGLELVQQQQQQMTVTVQFLAGGNVHMRAPPSKGDELELL